MPQLGRLKQKDLKFQISLGYTVSPCLIKTNKQVTQNKQKLNQSDKNKIEISKGTDGEGRRNRDIIHGNFFSNQYFKRPGYTGYGKSEAMN